MRSSLAPSVVGRVGSSGVLMPRLRTVVNTFWMPTSLKRCTDEMLRDCWSDCRSVMVPGSFPSQSCSGYPGNALAPWLSSSGDAGVQPFIKAVMYVYGLNDEPGCTTAGG